MIPIGPTTMPVPIVIMIIAQQIQNFSETSLKGMIAGSIQQMDISEFEPGAYILSITGGKDMYSGKFIKE